MKEILCGVTEGVSHQWWWKYWQMMMKFLTNDDEISHQWWWKFSPMMMEALTKVLSKDDESTHQLMMMEVLIKDDGSTHQRLFYYLLTFLAWTASVLTWNKKEIH